MHVTSCGLCQVHNERAAEKESSSESIKKFESVVMNKLHEVKLELHRLYIFLIPARPQKSPRLILDLVSNRICVFLNWRFAAPVARGRYCFHSWQLGTLFPRGFPNCICTLRIALCFPSLWILAQCNYLSNVLPVSHFVFVNKPAMWTALGMSPRSDMFWVLLVVEEKMGRTANAVLVLQKLETIKTI